MLTLYSSVNRKSILFLILLFSGHILLGQGPKFEHLSETDGLVNSNVTCILKDSHDFMWFGTYNGISRYDGYRFYNYTTIPGDKSSISGSLVRCLYETRNGVLLIGMQFNGICIYDRMTDTFKRFNHEKNNINSLMHDFVLAIHEDKKGNVWIGTRGGLDKFDIKTQTFTHFYPFKDNDRAFVSSIAEDNEGRLWLYSIGHELCIFNPSNNSFVYKSFEKRKELNLTFNRGGSLKWDNHGFLWVGNDQEGVFRIDTSTFNTVKFNTANKKLNSNSVTSISKDSKGIIWISTDGGGIYKYEYEKQKLTNWYHEEQNPSSLTSNAVYVVYESDPGIIWAGLYASGINKWVSAKQKFGGYNAKGIPNKCISQKSVLSIAETKNGEILLGTDGGGLNLFDPLTHNFTYYKTSNSSICFDIIKSISVDNDQNIWMGSYNKGMCRWNLGNLNSKNYLADYRESPKALFRNDIWALKHTSEHELYIGLLSGGFDMLNTKSGLFRHNLIDTTCFNNQANLNVFAFELDSLKRVWVAIETKGIICYDPKLQKTDCFNTENSFKHSLLSNDIRDVFIDSKGNLWIATFYGGLLKLIDFKKKEFVSYTMKNGLNTNNIMSILEDDHQRIWLSTDKGISMFDPNLKRFQNYEVEDGLTCREHNYHSKCKATNGYLYFGGVDGFNFFHPDSLIKNKKQPEIVITELRILNETIRPDTKIGKRKILNTSVFTADRIELEYTDNIIELEFAALDYSAPKKNRYAYKLEGFDDDWRLEGANKRTATYTNLNPGTYVFKVKGSNNYGVWNNHPQTLTIVILPPWWATWWFRTGMVMSLIAVIYGYYYSKINQVKQQNLFLEQEVKNRTADLKKEQEIKDKFYSIIAHDLKNPVSALKVLTEILTTECKNHMNNSQLELVKNVEKSAGRLHKLVISLLDWTKTQTSHLVIKKEKLDLYDIIKDNIELHTPQTVMKNIRISNKIAKGFMINADKDMISTIVRNLTGNAIKFTPTGGDIHFEIFAASENRITLMIQDSGVGIEKQTLDNLIKTNSLFTTSGTENEKGTGLGIMISKEFIVLNGGTMEVKSELGKGTAFLIHFPGKVEASFESNAEETPF